MAAIRDYLFRNPERGGRHVVTAASGFVLISVGSFYAGLPQVVRISLISIGVLNLLLGGAELVPNDHVRLAGALRATAYLAFAAGLALAGIVAAVSGG